MKCDPKTGKVDPILLRRNMERFKGTNDVIVARNGDICAQILLSLYWNRLIDLRFRSDFTDQGQTGMTDQTGLVYRLSPTGKLDTLLQNGISPNGLVLNPEETVSLLDDEG